MESVILAGGYGTRLKPLTDSTPKPLLSIANKPMLDYVISGLNRYGINKTTLAVSYLSDQIMRYIKARNNPSMSISTEDEPLGTAGGVKKARKRRGGTFIVTSGDALSDIDYEAILSYHTAKKADITIAVTRVQNPSLYGVVKIEDGVITNFREKPKDAKPFDFINCGIYVINDYVMDLVPSNVPYDFAKDLFPIVLEFGMIAAYQHNGYWRDVGDFNSYYRANFDVLGGNGNLLDENAHIYGECANCIVGKNAYIHSNAHLEYCIVLPNTSVFGVHRNCILGDGYLIDIPGGYEYMKRNDVFLNTFTQQ